jgi:hypothetical protein
MGSRILWEKYAIPQLLQGNQSFFEVAMCVVWVPNHVYGVKPRKVEKFRIDLRKSFYYMAFNWWNVCVCVCEQP